MKNLKVRTKLMAAFLIVIALTVAVGIVGIVSLYTLDMDYTFAIETHGKPMEDAGHMLADLHAARAEIRAAIIFAGNAERVQQQTTMVRDFLDDFEARAAVYDASVISADSRKLFDDALDVYHDAFVPAVDTLLANALSPDAVQTELAAFMVSDIKPNVDLVQENIEQCLSNKATNLDTTSAEGTALFNSSFVILIVLVAVSAAVSVVLALYISGIISRPLGLVTAFMGKAGTTGDLALGEADKKNLDSYGRNKDEVGRLIHATAAFVNHVSHASATLEAVAKGDLTVEMQALSDKDSLGLSLQQMSANFNRTFNEFNSSSHQVATGSSQVADGAQALAQGSTQQAASIQELSSAITQIAEKTKENAEMAGKSAQLAASIIASAEKGSRQMEEMITATKDIGEASQSIGKVIKTIDDIAFQTNILALNAAVEAARAGQHGKGFAVVAEEVRNLASKSAEAAKDTGALIENSISKAELGERIAGETAASLAEIVSGINESSRLASDIAHSSETQSAGIGEINIGIDQVAQVVQQNSATAEQSAAAAQEMSSQSTILQELIAQFKIRDGGTAYIGGGNAGQRRAALPPKAGYQAPADTGTPIF